MNDFSFSAEQIESARKIFAGPCDFLWGAADLNQLPPPTLPEIAFAGRSNVGKSSLINALCGRKGLAHTSSMPGRTQQLNFFKIGDIFTLVDMPGYGFAKVSKQQRAAWDELIFTYLRGRAPLRCVFVLIDSRQGLKESDEHLMTLLDGAAVAYRIVMTKADKESAENRAQHIEDVKIALKKHPAAFPEVLLTSAQDQDGIAELRALIISLVE